MTEGEAEKKLENVVKDAYIVYFETKGTAASEAEAQGRFEQLVQKAEQLQQQYGSEKFTYRRFEYVKSIAAVIKDSEIIETLVKEGYSVKAQGRFTI